MRGIELPRRRFLAAGLGVGAVAIASRAAEANQPFTTYGFTATGEPAPRTMPDRLAEIKNVRDFGAVGDGVADDWGAIQAAVNWTSGANRGTIYFPLGSYSVSQPITFNFNGALSICFRGESAGSTIFGNFNGFIFDRSLGTPNNTTGGRGFEKLQIQNPHNTGGAIRLGSTNGGYIRDCILSGHINFTAEDSVGNSSQNIIWENVVFGGAGTVTGSSGVIIGGPGALVGCDFTSCDVGVRIYGSGFQMAGNRIERCNTAILCGLDSGGNNVGASGFSLSSGTCEGNWTAIDLAGLCTGFTISSYADLGHALNNAGVTPGIQGTQYGIRIRADCAQGGVISGYGSGNYHDIACIAIENASARANVVFVGCTATQSGGGGVSWLNPTNAQTALFFNNNNQPIWTFSQLPTGGNRLEGDEFDISDSTTATWGANVTTGGGASRCRVRYNGTNWTVMGV